MKLLIEKIANTDAGVKLRNLIGFRPNFLRIDKGCGAASISDAFPWRTDNGYSTTFRYIDILGLFYKFEESYVELEFYSQSNNLIKKIVITSLNYSNELLIDKDFLNGLEGYGVFYIFHRCDNYNSEDLLISNRCYVGFSNRGSLNSFVHGNIYVKSQSLDGTYRTSGMIQSSLVKNQYRIQNSFREFSKTELFFVNPTSKQMRFSVGGEKYRLATGCSIVVNSRDTDNISILSRCLFLRPIVFNYRDCFLDVAHG